MKILAPVLIFLTVFAGAGAQPAGPGKKIKTLTLSDTLLSLAIDRPGDFYAVTATGQIQRFDRDGKLTLLYKSDTVPTLFDPRDGARLFLYCRRDQHYQFVNPSFHALASYKIDPSFAIQPWLVCPSGEYKLWILDQADQSLKKVNVRESQVEVEVVVDSTLIGDAMRFKTMREYQNFVFLLNPGKGIFIFSSLGRHIKTIEGPQIANFNFLGEELYYLEGDSIRFFNLFSAESREIKIPAGYTGAVLSEERMILYTPERIDIFSFHP